MKKVSIYRIAEALRVQDGEPNQLRDIYLPRPFGPCAIIWMAMIQSLF